MSKKTIIILAIIFIIIILAGIGFYLYKKGYFIGQELTPEKLLVFENKDTDLPAANWQRYLDNYNVVKAALEKNPDDFVSWLQLGILKKAVEDYEGSRDVFLYATKIRPQSSTPFASLADLYAYFLNEPERAEEAIKTAIANDPNDYSFYIALADIYRYKIPGKEAKYETTLLDALKALPDNPNLISALATYYRQTNQTDKAIEFYEKLLAIYPDNQSAKQDLAELKSQK